MSDNLISRSELKKHKFTTQVCNGLEIEDVDVVAVATIDNAPTVVAENATSDRPQGEWIDTGDMNEYWAEEYQCSICGAKDHWHNYCPKCGAEMRGRDR